MQNWSADSRLASELFPNHSLQERQANFSEFFEIYGEDLISVLVEHLKPLDQNFDVICLRK